MPPKKSKKGAKAAAKPVTEETNVIDTIADEGKKRVEKKKISKKSKKGAKAAEEPVTEVVSLDEIEAINIIVDEGKKQKEKNIKSKQEKRSKRVSSSELLGMEEENYTIIVDTTADEAKEDQRKKKKNRKRKKVNPDELPDEEENLLAMKLFGAVKKPKTAEDDGKASVSKKEEKSKKKKVADSSDDDEEMESGFVKATSTSTAVWHDEDDVADASVQLSKKKSALLLKKSTDVMDRVDSKEYQKRLREAFQRTHNAGKTPTWAKIEKKTTKARDDEEDSDDEVMNVLTDMTRSTGTITVRDTKLPKGVLDVTLIQDITIGHADKRPLNILKFHKTRPILLTAGESGMVQLFKIDSDIKKDHFLQNMKFQKFPITSMDFVTGGQAVLCGSRSQTFLMKYDLNTGIASQMRFPRAVPLQNAGKFAVSSDGVYIAMAARNGQIYILTTSSMEYVKTLSVPADIVHIAFATRSSSELWVQTETGHLYVFHLSSGNTYSFMDEGVVKGTTFSMSSDGQTIACGSNSGIVNIYDGSGAKMDEYPKPIFTISSLTTSCESIAFSHDNQMIAVGSSVKKNSLKLIHTKSNTVFKNFPLRNIHMPAVQCVDFSPNSGYMAVGGQNGQLMLYRLAHYEGY